MPWDIFDRLFLPVLYCHAVAIIITGFFEILGIRSAFSTFSIFIILSLLTVGGTLFFHNLKVSKLSIIQFICPLLPTTHQINSIIHPQLASVFLLQCILIIKQKIFRKFTSLNKQQHVE